MARTGLLERLKNGFVLGDGSYLMTLSLRGFLVIRSPTPEIIATRPEEVRKLAREFKDAGAEVLQTLTFFGTSNMLERAGLGDRAEEINRTACRIAREVAGEEALVAGNLCSPTILYKDYDPSDPSKRERTRAWLDEQLAWICDEQVDFLILETFSWLDEALVAVEVARKTGLTLVTTVSPVYTGGRDGKASDGFSAGAGEDGKTFDGFSPAECARRLVDAGADVVGVNCLQRPRGRLAHAIEMRRAVDAPICCQPSAWHTWWADSTPASPQDFAEFVREGVAADIRYLGACCGAGPEHIRAMAEALGKIS